MIGVKGSIIFNNKNDQQYSMVQWGKWAESNRRRTTALEEGVGGGQ